jgi:hypothetical protein
MKLWIQWELPCILHSVFPSDDILCNYSTIPKSENWQWYKVCVILCQLITCAFYYNLHYDPETELVCHPKIFLMFLLYNYNHLPTSLISRSHQSVLYLFHHFQDYTNEVNQLPYKIVFFHSTQCQWKTTYFVVYLFVFLTATNLDSDEFQFIIFPFYESCFWYQ